MQLILYPQKLVANDIFLSTMTRDDYPIPRHTAIGRNSLIELENKIQALRTYSYSPVHSSQCQQVQELLRKCNIPEPGVHTSIIRGERRSGRTGRLFMALLALRTKNIVYITINKDILRDRLACMHNCTRWDMWPLVLGEERGREKWTMTDHENDHATRTVTIVPALQIGMPRTELPKWDAFDEDTAFIIDSPLVYDDHALRTIVQHVQRRTAKGWATRVVVGEHVLGGGNYHLRNAMVDFYEGLGRDVQSTDMYLRTSDRVIV